MKDRTIFIAKILVLAVSAAVLATQAQANQSTAMQEQAGQSQRLQSADFWWPEQLDLRALRQHAAESSPLGPDFNYTQAFNKLDIQAVKKDIESVMKTSQPWWPADYGNYGPFFIRMAWHSAGTYRMGDGRGGADGGQQRFDPLNSWPDNVSLDKARRLLWPVKQKYGSSISWADLMVLAGNVALESMGFKTFGYAGGRIDQWEPDMVYWGPEKQFLSHDGQRFSGKRQLKQPLGATEMGLIYVNPEGPNGKPDPLAAAKDIREAFGRMAMNDEETVALIAGGHTFGKAHGAHKPKDCVGAEPAAAALEQQGLGWNNKCGKGNAEDTTSSGLEGAWSTNPTRWTHEYLTWLYTFDWVQTKSPAGAIQWIPKDGKGAGFVPDAHLADKRHAPIMFTTDLAVKLDPEYHKISKRFLDDPKQFELAFAKAWFKLTHRDLGPRARYLGQAAPAEILIWQDPLPTAAYSQIDAADISALKTRILASGLTVPELVRTAWAAAVTFRGTDMRGGANGGRLALAPQKDWAVNNPAELGRALQALQAIQADFNRQAGGKQVSLADLIVLGGAAGVEKAAAAGGHQITVAFTPGRVDASQAQTDVAAFAVLEPKADAFRNYYSKDNTASPAEMLVDRANLLTLTVPEMTVLMGGLRSLNANSMQNSAGVLTERPGVLSNDVFVNLLSMSTQWKKAAKEGLYEGRDRASGKLKWTASPVDLVFGSNSELRAVAEAYATEDAKDKFVQDFVRAWNKVMMLDRFDLH